MPHYKDGTEAKIGDRVRGVGYNNYNGKAYDPKGGIEGIVTEIRGGENKAGSCTLTVAYLAVHPQLEKYSSPVTKIGGATVSIAMEYGDTVCFEKVS